jgi:hypothetical protein
MKAAHRIQNKIIYLAASSLRHFSGLLSRAADRVETFRPMGRDIRELLRENARFREIHKGRRAFVIGNGPSLNRQNLSLLKHELTFTCNSFFLHPILAEWQPTYHALMEATLFDGTVERGLWFEQIRHKMPQTTFFVPAIWKKAIEEKHLLADERTHYIGFSGHMNMRLTSVDIAGPVPGGESTVLLSLLLALYMGCDPIYLLGMDHDWLTTRNMDTHFYPLDTQFYNGCRLGTDLSKIPYDSDALSIQRLWAGHRNLKAFGEARGVRIQNATDEGFLDVFERVTFDSLFEGAGKTSQQDLFPPP